MDYMKGSESLTWCEVGKGTNDPDQIIPSGVLSFQRNISLMKMHKLIKKLSDN